MAEAENLTDYTIETRAERINTRVYDDALRQGETDKVISKGSFSETVVGAETTTVGGHLTELYNDQVTSTLTTKTNTYEGPLTLTGTGDSTIMGGVSIDTQAGGIFIGAVMSDDLIAGGGVRLSAPCDMWLAGLVGMEEKIVTGVADGAFLDISSIYFEREFVTSNYAIGTATLTGTLHATTKAGFKALFKVNQGVRNLAPGGGGGGGGAPSAPVLPPAAAEGAASAGGMAQSAARAGTSIEDSSDLRMLATRLDDAEIATDLPAGGATTSLTQRQPMLELATSLEDGTYLPGPEAPFEYLSDLANSLEDGTARLDDAAGSTPAAVLELDEGAEGAQLFDNWARGNADDAADFQARFDDANWQDLFSGDQVDFANPERVASDEVKNFDFKEALGKIKTKELKYRRGDDSVWTEWQSYMALHDASSDAADTARDFVANVTPGPGLNGAWDSAADYEDFVAGLSGLPVDDLRGKLASQVDAARASQDYDKLVLLQNSLDALDAKIDDIFSTATTKAAGLEGSGFKRLSKIIDTDALTEVLTIEHDKLLKQFNDASDAAASGNSGLDDVLTLTQRIISLETAQKAVVGGLDPIAVINNDLLALRLSPVAATDPNLVASITAFQDLSAQLEVIFSRGYVQKLYDVDLDGIAQFNNLAESSAYSGSSPYATIADFGAGVASNSGSSVPYANIDDLGAGVASHPGSSVPYANIDDLGAGVASHPGSSVPYANIDDLGADFVNDITYTSVDFDDVVSTTSRSSDTASGAGKAATDGGANADPSLYATVQRAPSPEVPQRPEGLWESAFSKLDDSVPTGSLGELDFDEATRLDLEPRQLDVSDIDSRPPTPLPEEDVYALAGTDSAFDDNPVYALAGTDSTFDADDLLKIDDEPVYAELRTPGRRDKTVHDPKPYHLSMDDVRQFRAELPQLKADAAADARAPLPLPDEAGIIDNHYNQLQRIDPQGRRQPRVPATPDGYATLGDDIANPGVRSGADIDARAPLPLPDESGIIDSRLTPPNFEDPDDTYTRVPDQLQRIDPQGRRQPRLPEFNVPATPDGYATVIDDISNPGVRSGADIDARAPLPLPDESGIIDSRLTPPNFEDPDDTYTRVPDQLQRIDPQGRRQPRLPEFNVPATPDGYATVIDDISNPGVRSGADVNARAPLPLAAEDSYSSIDDLSNIDSRAQQGGLADLPGPSVNTGGARWQGADAASISPYDSFDFDDAASTTSRRSGDTTPSASKADAGANAEPASLLSDDYTYSTISRTTPREPSPEVPAWDPDLSAVLNVNAEDVTDADSLVVKQTTDALAHEDNIITIRNLDSTETAAKVPDGLESGFISRGWASDADYVEDAAAKGYVKKAAADLQSGIDPRPGLDAGIDTLRATEGVDNTANIDLLKNMKGEYTEALNSHTRKTAAKVPDGLESSFISRGWASDADYVEDAAAKGYVKKAAADLQSGIDPRPGLDAGIDTLRATEGVDNTANIDLLKSMKGEYTEALNSHTRKTAAKVPDGLESSFISRGWASDADYVEDAAAKGYAKKAAADLQSGIDPRPGLDAGIDTLRATEGVDNTANTNLLKSMKVGLKSSKRRLKNIDLLMSMKGEYTAALSSHTRKLEQADKLLAQAPLPSAALQAEEAVPRSGILSIPDVETASDFHDSHDLTKIDDGAVAPKKKKSVSFGDHTVTTYDDSEPLSFGGQTVTTYDNSKPPGAADMPLFSGMGDGVRHAKRREPLPHNRLESLFGPALEATNKWSKNNLLLDEEASDNIIIVQNIINSKGIIEEQSTPAIHISIINRLENTRKHGKLGFMDRRRAKKLVDSLRYYRKTGQTATDGITDVQFSRTKELFDRLFQGESFQADAIAKNPRTRAPKWHPISNADDVFPYHLHSKEIEDYLENWFLWPDVKPDFHG